MPRSSSKGACSPVTDLFDQQFAIAFDRIQRRAKLVAQAAPIRRIARRFAGDRFFDQRGELGCCQPHPLEIGDKILETLPARILDQNVDKADDRGDGGAKFLPQKGGDRVLEPSAAHDRSPVRARSASIFCNSRANSTGFVS